MPRTRSSNQSKHGSPIVSTIPPGLGNKISDKNQSHKNQNICIYYGEEDQSEKKLYDVLIQKLPSYHFIIINQSNVQTFAYEECLTGLVLANDASGQHMIKQLGGLGLVAINNGPAPNCVNYYDDSDYLIYLIEFISKNYHRVTSQIKNSMSNYLNGRNPVQTVLIMAEHKRSKIFEANLRLLQTQNGIHQLVIAVTDQEDINVCKKLEINYCITRNQPLGEKWQHALIFAKIFYPKYVIILGSDDFILQDYVPRVLEKFTDFDLYIQNFWVNYDIVEEKIWQVCYSDTSRGTGSGRIVSSRILNQVDWKLFPIHLSTALDNHSNAIIEKHTQKIINNNDSKLVILSPKYHIECMNPQCNLINNDNFRLLPYIFDHKLARSIKAIKRSFLVQYQENQKLKHTVNRSFNIEILEKNIVRTTSSISLKIKDKKIIISIPDNLGTPGIYVKNINLQPNKYYKVVLKGNREIKNLSMSIFLTYKSDDKIIRYNKSLINQNQAFFDTIDIDKMNALAIFTPIPCKAVIEIYSIVIQEIKWFRGK